MEEATSKGGLSRFSVSLSSKQTDRKSLINNDQGSNQFKNYITLLFNDIYFIVIGNHLISRYR